jgi:hypothetical protein
MNKISFDGSDFINFSFPLLSLAAKHPEQGISLQSSEQNSVVVESQQEKLKKLNTQQPVIKKSIIIPLNENQQDTRTFAPYKSNQLLDIDAPIKKIVDFRRDSTK